MEFCSLYLGRAPTGISASRSLGQAPSPGCTCCPALTAEAAQRPAPMSPAKRPGLGLLMANPGLMLLLKSMIIMKCFET